jgi:glycosyltransferase involved in cell wall biosynthesis
MTPDIASVTVIVPCYNASRFVARTLSSIFAQTVKTRVVAVDDGSTDDTLAVLRSFGDRITIVHHEGEVNEGVSASRNRGMSEVSSPYVAFLDADDLWHPETIAEQLRVMERNAEVGVAIVGCRAIDSNDKPLYDFELPTNIAPEALPEALLVDCFIQTPGQALFRRSVLESVGLFDAALRGGEDHDMWLRLSEHTRFAFIDRILLDYRKHSSSVSQAGARMMWETGFRVVEKAERRGHRGPALARRRAVLHYRLAECARAEGDRTGAMKHMLQAAFYDPARGLRVLATKLRLTP